VFADCLCCEVCPLLLPAAAVMPHEQIVLRVLFAVLPFAVLGIASTIVLSRIFKRLNKRLPKREQSEFFGRWPGKVSRVRKLYREYYPDSRLEHWETGLEVLGSIAHFPSLPIPVVWLSVIPKR